MYYCHGQICTLIYFSNWYCGTAWYGNQSFLCSFILLVFPLASDPYCQRLCLWSFCILFWTQDSEYWKLHYCVQVSDRKITVSALGHNGFSEHIVTDLKHVHRIPSLNPFFFYRHLFLKVISIWLFIWKWQFKSTHPTNMNTPCLSPVSNNKKPWPIHSL